MFRGVERDKCTGSVQNRWRHFSRILYANVAYETTRFYLNHATGAPVMRRAAGTESCEDSCVVWAVRKYG